MTRIASTLALALAATACNPTAPPPAVAFHQPGRILGATDIGPADPAEVIGLVLAVKLRQPEKLPVLMRAQGDHGSSLFKKFLTPAQYGDSFGASADDYQRLVDWAQASGLEIVSQSPSRSTLTVRGTTAVVEQAFGTHLRMYQDSRGTFRAPTGDLAGWPAISGLAGGIVGLDTAGEWRSHRVPSGPVPPPADPNRTNGGLDPIDLQTLYDAPPASAMPGLGQTVAILGTGFAPDPVQDVDGFIKKFKLNTINGTVRTQQYTQVFVGGPNRDNTNLGNNEYGENLLDIDMVLGMAPNASIVHVFTAQNGGGLFADGIEFVVNQLPNAHSVSLSFGSCERVSDSEVLTLNQLFQQAKSQGQQWFSASGDDGTDACRDGKGNNVLSVDWPSSSPYVLGVGGTTLNNLNVELGWGGSGGGESEIIVKPAFQIGVGPFPNDGVRDVPDIASVAGDPGVSTYAQGQVFPSQGTSAAAPTWAGLWALIDQTHGGTGISNGAEILYQLGEAQQAGGPAVFHDITSGGNQGTDTAGYTAGPGYDLVTGWGTPDIQALIANWPN
jgi:kumamolisin